MAIRDRFPGHFFSSRGWGLLGAGAVSLLAAQIMGRRDLLALAVLLLVLPVLALAGTRVLKPRFRVYREFSPSPVETSARATVRLAVARTGAGTGHAVMEEHLPARFGESPVFRFPARAAAGGTSRYEYHLRSARRGQFLIGPVTAEFSDPFGLSFHRHAIDDGDLLTVTPAAIELPETGLAGARGHDGVTPTRARANPSDDDVMTREYRHGDPMRRVHWAATARHGSLMVRQEESVTTPEATIILDQRLSAYPHGVSATVHIPPAATRAAARGRPRPAHRDAFEWAVTAAMSDQRAPRGTQLRAAVPGQRGRAGLPAFALALPNRRPRSTPARAGCSPSPKAWLPSSSPARTTPTTTTTRAVTDGAPPPGPPAGGRGGTGTGSSGRDGFRSGAAAGTGNAPAPFDDTADGQTFGPPAARTCPGGPGQPDPGRGPGAVPGRRVRRQRLRPARRGPGTDSGEVPEVLEALRLGGWRALAVSAQSSLPDAWAAFDQADPGMSAGADVRRGVGGRP